LFTAKNKDGFCWVLEVFVEFGWVEFEEFKVAFVELLELFVEFVVFVEFVELVVLVVFTGILIFDEATIFKVFGFVELVFKEIVRLGVVNTMTGGFVVLVKFVLFVIFPVKVKVKFVEFVIVLALFHV